MGRERVDALQRRPGNVTGVAGMSRGEEIIESILKKHGYVLDEERPRAVNGNGRDSDSPFRDLNELALKNLEAWVPDLGIYNCVRQRGRFTSYVGVAQWRRSTAHGDDLEKRDRNLKICSSGIKDFGDDRRYTPLNLVMAAKGIELKEAVNWLDEKLGWSSGGPEFDVEAAKAKQEEQRSEQEAEQPKNDNKENEQPKKEKRRIRLVPYELPDPAKIPRREWLYGYHYMRKIVSATIGPGGIGKSSLGLVEAISMAIGRDLLGKEKLRRPLRVWYHNGEDSRDELDRRISAICIHYRVQPRELNGGLIVTCGLDMPIKVASGGNEVVLDKRLKAEITQRIIEEKTDVEIFDPLVTLHNTTESLSSTMDPVIRDFFGVIANETDTGIELAITRGKRLPAKTNI